jgi:hypothetical protein
MPERLDRVGIIYSRGVVEIPWASRDALLEEIRHLDSAKGIRDEFMAVGASRLITLNRDEAALLVQAIDVWLSNAGGPQRLPSGIFRLRNALLDHLHDTRSE